MYSFTNNGSRNDASETRLHLFRTRPGIPRFTEAVALPLLSPIIARAGGVVTNRREAALRAARAGGGQSPFACDGNITLAGRLSLSINHCTEMTERSPL
jgi:hypothetical protein